MATKNFDDAIYRSAISYAGYVTVLARKNVGSTRIGSTIHSSVERDGSKYHIRVRAGGKNAPDARAREFGSGLHGRLRAKYPIRPKKAGGALVFPWDKADPSIPRVKSGPKAGQVILPMVMHPGVKPYHSDGQEGYIRPAIVKAKKTLRKNLKLRGSLGIRNDLRSSFKGATVK